LNTVPVSTSTNTLSARIVTVASKAPLISKVVAADDSCRDRVTGGPIGATCGAFGAQASVAA
jgi:hypothetical protein